VKANVIHLLPAYRIKKSLPDLHKVKTFETSSEEDLSFDRKVSTSAGN
jgi:hypothetical protein